MFYGKYEIILIMIALLSHKLIFIILGQKISSV